MRLLACLCIMLAPVSAAAAGERVLQYEPCVSILTGLLRVEAFFGPPNYGENPETDSVENALILVLDAPVTVIGDPLDASNNTTFEQIEKIQLASVSADEIAVFAGRRVSVTGQLFQRHTGHHHTDVLMLVDAVVPGQD